MSIAEFAMPFEINMDKNNRWTVLSHAILCDKFAELYNKNFPSHRGAPTNKARLVLEMAIVRHI